MRFNSVIWSSKRHVPVRLVLTHICELDKALGFLLSTTLADNASWKKVVGAVLFCSALTTVGAFRGKNLNGPSYRLQYHNK